MEKNRYVVHAQKLTQCAVFHWCWLYATHRLKNDKTTLTSRLYATVLYCTVQYLRQSKREKKKKG